MFIITDKDNNVVDISTKEENLSLGLTFPDHKIYDVALLQVNLGDIFDGKTVLINEELKLKREQDATDEKLIAQKIRVMAIEQLKLEGKLSEDFN